LSVFSTITNRDRRTCPDRPCSLEGQPGTHMQTQFYIPDNVTGVRNWGKI